VSLSPNDRMLIVLQEAVARHFAEKLPAASAHKVIADMNEIRYEADAHALATKTEREVLTLYYNVQRRLRP
jgi:hypothetical protein